MISLYLALPKNASWRQMTKAVENITQKMAIDGFKPDIVILYGRGGAIFGGLLAGNLGNIPVASIDRDVIDNSGVTDTKIINSNVMKGVKGKKVLFVTGEVITGNQLAKSKIALKKAQPSAIKTASYYVCDSSIAYPDYYQTETKSAIRAPWRIKADYKRTSKRGLLAKPI